MHAQGQGCNLAGMGGSAGYYMHGRPPLGGDAARPQQPRSHAFPFAYAAGGCYWAVPVMPTGAYACPAYQARACWHTDLSKAWGSRGATSMPVLFVNQTMSLLELERSCPEPESMLITCTRTRRFLQGTVSGHFAPGHQAKLATASQAVPLAPESPVYMALSPHAPATPPVFYPAYFAPPPMPPQAAVAAAAHQQPPQPPWGLQWQAHAPRAPQAWPSRAQAQHGVQSRGPVCKAADQPVAIDDAGPQARSHASSCAQMFLSSQCVVATWAI